MLENDTVTNNDSSDGFERAPPRLRVVPPRPAYANAWCALCGHWFLTCDGGPPLDEKGAKFFQLPVGSYVCFWCFDSYNDDPADPAPKLYQHGRA
jgi:hypothetical protein